jgi:hypothetical protein
MLSETEHMPQISAQSSLLKPANFLFFCATSNLVSVHNLHTYAKHKTGMLCRVNLHFLQQQLGSLASAHTYKHITAYNSSLAKMPAHLHTTTPAAWLNTSACNSSAAWLHGQRTCIKQQLG